MYLRRRPSRKNPDLSSARAEALFATSQVASIRYIVGGSNVTFTMAAMASGIKPFLQYDRARTYPKLARCRLGRTSIIPSNPASSFRVMTYGKATELAHRSWQKAIISWLSRRRCEEPTQRSELLHGPARTFQICVAHPPEPGGADGVSASRRYLETREVFLRPKTIRLRGARFRASAAAGG